MSFVEALWLTFEIFIFIAYLMILFSIFQDLFRDHNLNVWWKVLWILFLLFVPILTALVYVIARGAGMHERSLKAYSNAQAETNAYIRSVAGTSAAEQIAAAKALLDEGTITPAEFETLKAKALS